jgi:para-nitrobenzyl esterase
MAASMGQWADAITAHGHAKVYSYEFARPHSYAVGVKFSDLDPATAGAYHTSEVPFWLGTLDSFNRYRTTRAWTPADVAFSKMMTRSLVAFARSGSPETPDLHWKVYDPKAPMLLRLGTTAQIAPWPDQQKFDFFRKENAPSRRVARSETDLHAQRVGASAKVQAMNKLDILVIGGALGPDERDSALQGGA